MLHSTRGIVFHSTKYAESSLIVKIYTGLFGLQSYLVKGVRNPKSKIKPGLFQPLTLLDLVVYHREKHSLQSVKEIRLAHPYHSIPFDIRKSSLVLFINELVYKVIREEETNPSLFEFLWGTCLRLDETDEPISSFHLFFAMHLCHHLGIFPHLNHSTSLQIFNLREGHFQSAVPEHPYYLNPENSQQFHALLEVCSFDPYGTGEVARWRSGEISLRAEVRDQLLETILLYYQLHLPGFKGLQSHQILRTVLS
jgi:DNA repair protein RecO (recombination protein O)